MSPEEIQLVERLALSLEAGLTAGQALQSVQIGPGDHLPNAVARGIEISRKYGSSLLPALRQLIEQARTENSIQEELASEFVAPQATIRLVGWLPVVAVALATVSGFDVLASLKQPVAFISILVGIVLVWVAKRWSHRILHGAMPQPNEHLQALRDFLLALSSGLTVRQARDELKTSTPVLELVAEELALCRQSGGAITPVLRGRLDQLTQKQFEADRNRVRRAGVQLALPLGVALLPALVFLVVIPMFTASSISNVSV